MCSNKCVAPSCTKSSKALVDRSLHFIGVDHTIGQLANTISICMECGPLKIDFKRIYVSDHRLFCSLERLSSTVSSAINGNHNILSVERSQKKLTGFVHYILTASKVTSFNNGTTGWDLRVCKCTKLRSQSCFNYLRNQVGTSTHRSSSVWHDL